jgi:hypothetical protein
MREIITDMDEVEEDDILYMEQPEQDLNGEKIITRYYYKILKRKYGTIVLEFVGFKSKVISYKDIQDFDPFIIIHGDDFYYNMYSKLSKNEAILQLL